MMANLNQLSGGNQTNAQDLTVYFDGGCPLCWREINVYRQHDKNGQLKFIDIENPNFNAHEEGLDPVEVKRFFHVKDGNGEIYRGVGAFVEIWKRLQKFHWIAWVAQFKMVRSTMELAYRCFARVRPYLPRRNSCTSQTCKL